MCASLKAPLSEDPRCPEVPNATRCAGSVGSGRISKYERTSRSMSTSIDGSADRPANSLLATDTMRLARCPCMDPVLGPQGDGGELDLTGPVGPAQGPRPGPLTGQL